MSTFILLSLIAGIPMYFRVWHALRPFMVDPLDLSRFVGVGQDYTIYSVTGRANNVSRGSSISDRVLESYTGTGATIHSYTTTITDQFFLTDAQGVERAFQLTNFNAAIASDHVVSVAWAHHTSKDKFVWLLVRNHTTGGTYLGDRDHLLQISTPHLQRTLLNGFLIFFPTVLVLLPLWSWLIRVQVKSFKRAGVAPLVSALDRAAPQFPQHGAIHADELDKLATLAKEGLLTSDEWTRAKNLFLGQPPDGRALALGHLGQVYSLYREGALSESEFNSKKWEILSRESRAKG